MLTEERSVLAGVGPLLTLPDTIRKVIVTPLWGRGQRARRRLRSTRPIGSQPELTAS